MTGAGAKHDAAWVQWLLVQHCHYRNYEPERFRDKIESRDDSASLETPNWMHPADDAPGEQAYAMLQGATDVARRVLRGHQQDVVVAGNRFWQAARLVAVSQSEAMGAMGRVVLRGEKEDRVIPMSWVKPFDKSKLGRPHGIVLGKTIQGAGAVMPDATEPGETGGSSPSTDPLPQRSTGSGSNMRQ